MTDGSTTWTYTYNADGLRTKRTNGSTTYSYVYNGSSLTQMTVGSDTLYFAYDGSSPMSVTYNGTNYYYATNIQGDVVAILNSSGTAVVQYTYDAWGNILTTTGSMASTLGAVNPLTYRGYVFDRETGLYYLQSRYYNPEIGRFINADAFASTGQGLLGNNMFAYCNNNPVLFSDASGTYLRRAFAEISFGEEGDYLTPTLGDYIESIAPPPKKTFNELIGHTHTTGLVIGSGMGGLTMGKSYSISNDFTGNFALQETDSYGTATSLGGGVSIGFAHTITNAKNVLDLNGEASVVGFTLCWGVGISIDLMKFVPSSGETKWGVTIAVLVGAEAEIHMSDSYTFSTKSGRLWQLFD